MSNFITHTTVQGETFDSLAFEYYTDEKLASTIIEANRKYADVLVFDADVELKIPVIEEDEQTPGTAPPWRM
jgi:phage tail protein X